MKELSEESKFQLSVKTIASAVIGLSMLIGMWFTLKADINEAKNLPAPEVTRTEYDLKDQLIRETIMNTQSDVVEIKEDLDGMDEKLDELQKTIYDLR